MKQLEEVLKEIQTTTKKISRVYLEIEPKEFKRQWILIFKALTGHNYSIDEDNKEIINQMYFYLVGSSSFNGSLSKGLMMTGNYGTGKTKIMEVIQNIIKANTNKRLAFLSCPSIVEELKKNEMFYFYQRPLIMDEIGRETQVVKDYGTDRQPIIEILTQRYRYNAWTFVTSNFTIETLGELYGGYIADRFKEMFNVIELTGKSRR